MKQYSNFSAQQGQLQKKSSQGSVDTILTDYKTSFQLKTHDEDTLQEKSGISQLKIEDEEPLQKMNKTGLPDALKSGVENLSGYSMDDVKVHYNSAKPAGLQAHAYAQGTDIHVAPGQEKHLPHEAWHVVQQKQGRVKPTMQMKGKVNVNDDAGLEKEADMMGAKAMSSGTVQTLQKTTKVFTGIAQLVIQRIEYSEAEIGKNYIVKGVSRRLLSKYSGWLKFDGLDRAVRASEVDNEPVARGSTGESPYSDMKEEYFSWTPQRTFGSIATPFGDINAKHNRKAPYITTNIDQYPDTSVRVDYKDIVAALKKEGIGDDEIADILLEARTDMLTDKNAIRAAAMLIGVVYLAEEWRKQGAIKIFRAILRLVQSGTLTLNDIPRVFEFVSSATDGREQVARIHEVLQGKLPFELLDADDQAILGAMSPMREGDLDSDEDMRETKEKDLKYGRAWGKYGKDSKKKRIDPSNIYKINDVFYNIVDPRIRHDGYCLWDTLELFDVAQGDLRLAATHAGIAYGNYVDIPQLHKIVNYLNNNGYDIQLDVNVFGYDQQFQQRQLIGSGSNVYRIGLVVDPHALGHFIPALN